MATKKVKKEKSWFSKLLADGETDTVSSKRLCMLVSMVVFIVLAFLSAFGHSATPEYIYILGGLVLGESGLSTAEKIKKNHFVSRKREEDDEETDSSTEENEEA